MNSLNTATVSLAVTPTVISTLLSHYLNRKPLHQRPTAHLPYDEGLHLIRSFLTFASHHTVEELQAFTSQWVPHPQWVKVEETEISDEHILRAANLLEDQLGPNGIRRVGGRRWWQWRKPNKPLKAEWIEMRADYHERKRNNDLGKRVMLYIHGGAYFFGSVDEHRYQMQRHARKLKARVFAPEYRLSPQYPFPAGLHDCLAAYLHLLTLQDPSTLLLAGDSAGGGMVLSLLVMLRDQGIPLPAGAMLISPWVDLTHSFPSVSGECPFDYIPPSGFIFKPSMAWPPPNEEELEELKKLALQEKQNRPLKDPESVGTSLTTSDIADASTRLSVVIDGETVEIKEQIQMYTTNELLTHPLVSPVMQPTLGGLPPLLIMVGGGERLRDEQIYVAHKCANPTKYLPPEASLDDKARAQIEQYKPTDVQLQVWDDLCHVAPTLSFTRPAKYMYRSIAQFGAWALARAQKIDIEILDDDQISVISSSTSDSDDENAELRKHDEQDMMRESDGNIGKAGDPLPPFKSHMIRQKVTRHGVVFALAPASELPGCAMARDLLGVVKHGPVKKWLDHKRQWDQRFSGTKKKVHRRRIKELAIGYEGFGEDEFPPPCALASRRKTGDAWAEKKRTKSVGLALWSLWGSKHDEMTMNRERQAPEKATATHVEGRGARSPNDLASQDGAIAQKDASLSRSRRRPVGDERQTAWSDGLGEETSVAEHLALQVTKEHGESNTTKSQFLAPDYHPPDTGVTGKRPYVDGIAVPFSLKKEAETASMMTLNSSMGPNVVSQAATPRPMSPATAASADGTDQCVKQGQSDFPVDENGTVPADERPNANPAATGANNTSPSSESQRPELEAFVTAADNLTATTGSTEH